MKNKSKEKLKEIINRLKLEPAIKMLLAESMKYIDKTSYMLYNLKDNILIEWKGTMEKKGIYFIWLD